MSTEEKDYVSNRELIDKCRTFLNQGTVFVRASDAKYLIELLTLRHSITERILVGNEITIIAVLPNEIFSGYTVKNIISHPNYDSIIRPRIVDKRLFIFLNGCTEREITSDIIFQKDEIDKTYERVEKDKWIIHDIHKNPKLSYKLRPKDFFNFYIANPELKLLNL